MSIKQKRKTSSNLTKLLPADKNLVPTEGEKIKQKRSCHTNNENKISKRNVSLASVLDYTAGLIAMIAISCAYSYYVYQIHENTLWFSNIKEVEREISFRTESGLYYSYYKQLVHSKSLWQGLKDLTEDKLTEHPDIINILARMNIYQEVILAFIYRTLQLKVAPIMFYIYCGFGLQAFLVSSLYTMAWVLSGSWLAGLLSATFYIFNKWDTSRVQNSLPLRESFSLPFLWFQAAALTFYFRSGSSKILQHYSLAAAAIGTFFFCLFWQFNQFVMMLQAFTLFGVWVLGCVPPYKVRNVMLCQLGSLLGVCMLQFGNKMIASSLAVSFIMVTLTLLSFQSQAAKSHSITYHLLRVAGLSLLALSLMVVLSTCIKILLNVDADEHIFKFFMNKITLEDTRDFDSRLYLCLEIFGFITWDVFQRLTENMVLPFYVPTHIFLLLALLNTVIKKWKLDSKTASVKEYIVQNDKGKELKDKSLLQETNGFNLVSTPFSLSPEQAFHTVQSVFFGALAIFTLRMKYLWTPYICVLASVGLANETVWSKAVQLMKINNKYLPNIARSSVLVLVLSIVTGKLLPNVLKEFNENYEFWDPDTVELMEWIKNSTSPTASFTGSMQLLAGVKLCTLRPITNHPHYEDKHLRMKTKQLYQIYGRRTPEDVHAILKSYNSNYIILEDSICRAPSRDGCRTPDQIDIDNGVMPDEYFKISGLVKSTVPRFCEMVRHQRQDYIKYFKTVFVNPTFRVYQVL